MAKAKRNPTQADLDVANAEIEGLTQQVRFLKDEAASAKQVRLRQEDDAFITHWCNILNSCINLPYGTVLSAAIHENGKIQVVVIGLDDIRRATDILIRRQITAK